MPRNDNYPDDIRSYDHDPRSPFYAGQGLEDAVEDASGEYHEDHAEMLRHLARLSIPHEVRAESDADEEGYNVTVTFLLETYGANGCEAVLLAAIKGLDPSDAKSITAALVAAHAAAV